MSNDFWTWLHLNGDKLDEAELGLIAEALRLAGQAGGGTVTVVAAGEDPDNQLRCLGDLGADHVLHLQSAHLAQYNGELFCQALLGIMSEHEAAALLMVHNPVTSDLAGRLGARLGSAVITRAVDAYVTDVGCLRAIRPIANGYLFETIEAPAPGTTLLTFLPAVLADPEPLRDKPIDIQVVAPNLNPEALATQTVEIIAADPQTLNIEEADIVVAGGRGVGKNEGFDIIHRLAKALGAAVAGTRPVIDDQTLPFERQIGQTGKTVSPRLIVNCGISGANEYTAGIEKSQLVIAINNDPKARIFRFADLGIVGDLHGVLPLLVQSLEEMAQQNES
jgi:electron transfer flavoprotein alpha subunit